MQDDSKEHARQPRLIFQINMQIIFAITLIAVMGVASITPAFPKIRDALGLTNQQVGSLITVFTLPGIFLNPVLGVLADRYGRKTIIVPSLFIFAVAGTACAFAEEFNTLLILRFF
ncbi:MAG: MFS transporter, partial [Bacteroidota bacterium]